MAFQQIDTGSFGRLTRQDILISLAMVASGLAVMPIAGVLLLLLID